MIHIQKVTTENFPLVLALLEQNALTQAGLDDHLSNTLIAYLDNRLSGCVALEHYGSYALLRSLVVDPSLRGLGIGKQLVKSALDLAETLRVKQIYLLTQTAHDFFAKFFNFTDIERSQVPPEVKQSVEFVSVCPQSAQVMMLALDHHDSLSTHLPYTMDMRSEVKNYYTERITANSSCCPSPAKNFYDFNLLAELPEDLANCSFGCGNPISFAKLVAGEVVLDLGSGAGLDCFLAANIVGKAGKVIGVDMTPAMIDRAKKEAAHLGFTQVEFRQGYLEDLPIEDASIDVIISNCVLNLSVDKPAVFKEMARVLKRGGRLAISDILSKKEIPSHLRQDPLAWASCASGALTTEKLNQALQEHGFTNIHITALGESSSSLLQIESGMLFSAIISAVKP